MDEEKLIILVSGYKELYDFAHKNYANQERKNNCWKEISQLMRHPISDCKDRWSRLRDNYRKALKFRIRKSGDAATKMKPYKFENEMSFLKKYLPDRDQKSNVAESVSIANSPEAFEEDEGNVCNIENSDSEPSTPASSSNTTLRAASPALKRKKTKAASTAQNSVASVLERYLKSTAAATSTSNPGGNNSLRQFFIAMSDTAESFPPALQIEVKSKIFNIIQEAELKCLQQKDTFHHQHNIPPTGFQHLYWNSNFQNQPPHIQPFGPQFSQPVQALPKQPSHSQHIQQRMLASQLNNSPQKQQEMQPTYSYRPSDFAGPQQSSDNESL